MYITTGALTSCSSNYLYLAVAVAVAVSLGWLHICIYSLIFSEDLYIFKSVTHMAAWCT